MPALAVSYTVSEDGLVYTFKIRPGVKWVDSQGREVADVKADDFVAGMQHMMDAMGGLEYLVQYIIVGADDYITKPFTIEELVARVKAHVRRSHRQNKSLDKNIICIGEIKINKENYEVWKNDKLVELSTREFELLSYLMTNAGIALSKEQIFDAVWGSSYGEIGTVAVHIKSLRKKLDTEEKYIKTIWGLGYKFIKVVE
mgnify:CR=1 FL=1